MVDEPRISFMTKEQLESYLSDLRSFRPQRPTGARPLNSAAKSRWMPQSSEESSRASSEPSTFSTASQPPLVKPATPSAKPPNEISRRSSWLLRRNSHKRSQTFSTPSLSSLSLRPTTPRPASSEKAQGWDGVSLQDGRMGDIPPSVPSLTRDSSEKKRDSFSFRDRFGGTKPNSGLPTNPAHPTGPAPITRKKSVTWALPSLSRPNSPPPVIMPPTHPPPRSEAPLIEQELTLHFSSLPTTALPTWAPLRINKDSSLNSGRSTPSTGGRSSVEPGLPAVSEISPELKEFSGTHPARREFIEPHMREPTQHNNPRYMTNRVALPSPPVSGSEEEDAEAEALRELGRRPLPKAGSSQTPGTRVVRRNTTKYGAQAHPPPPPVIGIVTTPSPPPTASSTSTNRGPTIPVIRTPDDDARPNIPSISLPDSDSSKDKRPIPSVPKISFPDSESSSSKPPTPVPSSMRRPLPTPRPFPKPPSSTASAATGRGPTASCAYCRTPIEGRVVSASSLRFHPECFRCDHCHTRLEHVGFFPEPEESRRKRIEAHQDDRSSMSSSSASGIGKIRFYCHLDFHELYSPRCRSCKTPIEGEVVMACGGTWHVGHFFCAECGDPFNSESKFVEKDGFAWCVRCYQNRYSGRCKKCRKPITETVVKALGAEWHEECFCCTECSSRFDDGRFFIRGKEGKEVPVCVSCEERRLKA